TQAKALQKTKSSAATSKSFISKPAIQLVIDRTQQILLACEIKHTKQKDRDLKIKQADLKIKEHKLIIAQEISFQEKARLLTLHIDPASSSSAA
ncbi:hypothetical protein H0H93_015949, partial [Arthromyces matolae]